MRPRQSFNRQREPSCVRMAFVFTVGFAVLILLIAQMFYSLDDIASVIEVSKFGFTVWRLSVFLLLLSGWPALTTIYADWAGLTAEQNASLKAYRWRMAGWLLVMEVLFCQTLWTDFVQSLLAMGAQST